MKMSAEVRARIENYFAKADRLARRAPVIIDVPLRVEQQAITPKVEAIPEEKLVGRCLRLSPSGRRCGRPTVGDGDDCITHLRWHRSVIGGIPYPGDADALRECMARAMAMTISGECTPQQAAAVAKLGAVIQKSLEREGW